MFLIKWSSNWSADVGPATSRSSCHHINWTWGPPPLCFQIRPRPLLVNSKLLLHLVCVLHSRRQVPVAINKRGNWDEQRLRWILRHCPWKRRSMRRLGSDLISYYLICLFIVRLWLFIFLFSEGEESCSYSCNWWLPIYGEGSVACLWRWKVSFCLFQRLWFPQ